MILTNARLFPIDRPMIPEGWIAFEDGRITGLGAMDSCPEAGERRDLGGSWVYPGLIDIHCHLGLFGDSLGFEGEDGNECTDPITPNLRAIDGINPFDRCFREAREGGITTILTGPGSANPIAGQFAALKTEGRWVDRMVIKAPCAMKFALGENPKWTYKDRDEAPNTRMATAALIREQLAKAQEYLRKQQEAEGDEDTDPPEFDAKLEALVPVIKGQLAAHFHAHRADDIATAVRIAKEFQLDAVLVHCTEGHLIADILAEEGYPAVIGPVFGDRSKPELSNQQVSNGAALSKAGVMTAICTDHPENPIQYLPLGAALAVKAGMDADLALRGITLNAAKIAGIDGRVGSLTVGKDADLAIFSGDLFAMDSRVVSVYIGGCQVK